MRSVTKTGTPATRPVVLITGAAGGLGGALAEAYARDGAELVLADIDEAGIDTLASRCPGALVAAADIRDRAACEALVAAALERFGRLDVLIHNAGLTHRSAFRDTDLEVIRRVFEVNFFAAVQLTAAALPHLLANRGTIVVVSSVAGVAPLIGRTGYAASKHALHGFFDTLRTEHAADGLGVVIVCPSFIDTGFSQRALDASGGRVRRQRANVGRLLRPGQVAEAVVAAVRRRRRLVLVSPVAHASMWLHRLAPALYERLMRRSQRAELSA